jgi:Zn-dependent peptidase ImmA (M78 family)
VGSASLDSDIRATAADIRRRLEFDLDERRMLPTWTDALRRCIEQADSAGVLVMCSGVVQNNNRRKLDPTEFRGFALVDALAPLVFINGADSKAAQMFTLAHELAHIWLGSPGVSDAEAGVVPDHQVEQWCNRVAAEALVPLESLQDSHRPDGDLPGEVTRLARQFKVSTLVILRRLSDAGLLTGDDFWVAYNTELDRLRAIPPGAGGNFYLTQAARLSRRFARALFESTLEGQTLHRDALRLLGFSKLETFGKLCDQLGVAD